MIKTVCFAINTCMYVYMYIVHRNSRGGGVKAHPSPQKKPDSMLIWFDLYWHNKLTIGHSAKGGSSSRLHQQSSKSKPSPSISVGDGPTRTSQRSIKRPRTYDEDNSEFESPPSASKSSSKKSKGNPKGSKTVGPKPASTTVPKVSNNKIVYLINTVHVHSEYLTPIIVCA